MENVANILRRIVHRECLKSNWVNFRVILPIQSVAFIRDFYFQNELYRRVENPHAGEKAQVETLSFVVSFAFSTFLQLSCLVRVATLSRGNVRGNSLSSGNPFSR